MQAWLGGVESRLHSVDRPEVASSAEIRARGLLLMVVPLPPLPSPVEPSPHCKGPREGLWRVSRFCRVALRGETSSKTQLIHYLLKACLGIVVAEAVHRQSEPCNI